MNINLGFWLAALLHTARTSSTLEFLCEEKAGWEIALYTRSGWKYLWSGLGMRLTLLASVEGSEGGNDSGNH